MLVRGAGLGAGLVNRAVYVLGRAIDGVEPEGLRAGIDHIVPRALGHDDAVIGLHLVALAVDPDFAAAGLDAEELIAVVVNFLADFIAGLDGHQDELKIVPGIKHAAEFVVFLGKLFDIANEALHACLLFPAAIA